jgi:hypothetical protein
MAAKYHSRARPLGLDHRPVALAAMVEGLGVAWLRSGARPLGPGGIVEGRDRRRDVPRGGNMGGVPPQAMEPRTSGQSGLVRLAKASPLAAGRAAR